MFKDFKFEIKEKIKKSRETRDSLKRRATESNRIPDGTASLSASASSRGGLPSDATPQHDYINVGIKHKISFWEILYSVPKGFRFHSLITLVV